MPLTALTEPAIAQHRRNDRAPTRIPDGPQQSLYQERYMRRPYFFLDADPLYVEAELDQVS